LPIQQPRSAKRRAGAAGSSSKASLTAPPRAGGRVVASSLTTLVLMQLSRMQGEILIEFGVEIKSSRHRMAQRIPYAERLMNAAPIALLTSVVMLAGCVGAVQLIAQGPMFLEHLDGNFRRIATCAYERLPREQGRLHMTDLPEQRTIKIAYARGSVKQWELAFIDEIGGRQTRLEVRSANGSLPSEHELALLRACAA
jgi:hypothetical protein